MRGWRGGGGGQRSHHFSLPVPPVQGRQRRTRLIVPARHGRMYLLLTAFHHPGDIINGRSPLNGTTVKKKTKKKASIFGLTASNSHVEMRRALWVGRPLKNHLISRKAASEIKSAQMKSAVGPGADPFVLRPQLLLNGIQPRLVSDRMLTANIKQQVSDKHVSPFASSFGRPGSAGL